MNEMRKIAAYIPLSQDIIDDINAWEEERRLTREVGPVHGPWLRELPPVIRYLRESRGHPAGQLRRSSDVSRR